MKQLAFALASAAVTAAAQPDDSVARGFVQQLVAAINRGDAASRRALMHPGARCEHLTTEGGRAAPHGPIPATHRWRIEPLPVGSKGLFFERFDYAVPPTHLLHIDYDLGPQRSHGLTLQLVRERDRWRETTGCPKLQTLEEARRAAPLRAQQEERINRVAAQLAPALKAEVMKLVGDGRKVDAIVHLRQATGEDLAVAKGVIDRLSERSR
jgi:hypothetical protein